jgi:phosphoribosylanthranilate isomerase
MVKLKICGMRDVRNIQDVAALGTDYMGFIFYQKSPRYVGDNFSVPSLVDPVKRVGVFVNESSEVMLKKVEELKLDYLQLHGQESVRQCEELRMSNVNLIKVFSVDDQFGFEKTKPYKGIADFFLFDTKGKYHGGNAISFNWNILERYDQETPFFLSGGIGPDNIREVQTLKEMNIHAVDINSGVEVTPGVKDILKINEVKRLLNSNA